MSDSTYLSSTVTVEKYRKLEKAKDLNAQGRSLREMADELGYSRSNPQKEAYTKAYNDALASTNSYRAA